MGHKIQTVIFDLDGLLIDSEIISYRLYQDLLKPYGYGFPVADYAQNYSGKTARKNMDAVIRRFSLPISMEQGLEFVFAQEKVYLAQGVPLKPGAEDLLHYLKQHGYQTALATSSIRGRALDILSGHGVDVLFDHAVFGPEVVHGKPSPDIFLKACEKAGTAPEDCLVLEDSEAGILAASAAHIPVICIPDMNKPSVSAASLTAAVLPSLHEVIPYLENL